MSTTARPASPPHALPVFPPQLEKRARETLSVLLMQVDMLPAIHDEHIAGIRGCVNDMADALLDGGGHEFDPAEPLLLRDLQYAHPVRVAQLSLILVASAGGARSHMRHAGLAALLMNAGYVKMRAPDLESTRAFDAAQSTQVQAHPQISTELLQAATLPQEVLDAIAQHHERWDGSGYPAGLRGKEISPIARVVGAADVYVALCSPRFQRPALDRHQVDQFFHAASGDLFDPRVVRLLVDDLAATYTMPHS